MQYCKFCKVSVRGEKRCCPLCRRDLTGEANPDEEAFAEIEPCRYNKNMLLRIVSFTAIAVILFCVTINLMVPTRIWWSVFVSAGVLCAWLTTAVGISHHRNIFNKILFQLFLVTLLAILWDVWTGWHGWSLDYVLPCSCAASMASMFVLSKVLKIPTREYLHYLVLDAFYGIVPILFLLTGSLRVILPSVLCVALSILSVAGLLIFEGKNMKEELSRKYHL